MYGQALCITFGPLTLLLARIRICSSMNRLHFGHKKKTLYVIRSLRTGYVSKTFNLANHMRHPLFSIFRYNIQFY